MIRRAVLLETEPRIEELVIDHHNELLLEIEPRLRELVRNHYHTNDNFEQGSFGDHVLQAARIAAFMMDGSRERIEAIFEDSPTQETFFSMVANELRESGTRLRFMTHLDRVIYNELSKVGGARPDLVRYHNGVVVCDIMELAEEDIRKLIDIGEEKAQAGDLQPELTEMIEILESRPLQPKYVDLTRAYHKSLVTLYEKVRTGNVRGWGRLSRGHESFFNWDVNLKGIGTHVIESHLLLQYGCSLENIPVQKGGLAKSLERLKLRLTYRFPRIRDFLLTIYPEMRNNPAWHPARWSGSHQDQPLSKKEKEEDFRYHRQYLFRYTLNCETREDVIAALNDEGRMKKALKAERMFRAIYGSKRKNRLLYSLIGDLDGRIFAIDPWELRAQLPIGTFRNQDGTLNRDEIGKYLLWAVENHGLNINHPNSHKYRGGNIPHYNGVIFNFTSSEIKSIYAEAKKQEQYKIRRISLFKDQLRCETREDVIGALNDGGRMISALKAARMIRTLYHGKTRKRHPYTLIENLDGDIFDIDLWELKGKLPKETFRNPDGSANGMSLGKYLLWAVENYGLDMSQPQSRKNRTRKIRHYYRVGINFTPSELKGSYAEAKRWQHDMEILGI